MFSSALPVHGRLRLAEPMRIGYGFLTAQHHLDDPRTDLPTDPWPHGARIAWAPCQEW